jgi:hypothetical protein
MDSRPLAFVMNVTLGYYAANTAATYAAAAPGREFT